MKGVRERETNSSEGKKCPRKGAEEVLEEQRGEEDPGTPQAQLKPGEMELLAQGVGMGGCVGVTGEGNSSLTALERELCLLRGLQSRVRGER